VGTKFEQSSNSIGNVQIDRDDIEDVRIACIMFGWTVVTRGMYREECRGMSRVFETHSSCSNLFESSSRLVRVEIVSSSGRIIE
jgi:hypothetical protein